MSHLKIFVDTFLPVKTNIFKCPQPKHEKAVETPTERNGKWSSFYGGLWTNLPIKIVPRYSYNNWVKIITLLDYDFTNLVGIESNHSKCGNWIKLEKNQITINVVIE